MYILKNMESMYICAYDKYIVVLYTYIHTKTHSYTQLYIKHNNY